MDVISKAISGQVGQYDFLFKLIFTAVAIGAGFWGGEIVSYFFVGWLSVVYLAELLDFFRILCRHSLISVFRGVTNCPIASLFVGVEFFGDGGLLYYLLTVSITHNLSGHYGLYQTRKRNNILKI